MHKIKPFAVALFSLVLAAGCVQLTGETDDEIDVSSAGSEYSEPSSLETSDNGGYDDSDEGTAFGLTSMEQYEADAEEEDPSVTEDEEAEMEEEEEDTAGAEVYMIRIVWGNLELNGRDDEDLVDIEDTWLNWTGSLSFNGDGALVLKRTILFDLHDRILDEDERDLIQWRSHTGPHIDGVLAKLIYLPSDDVENPTVTFETDLVTQEIAVAELDHYNEIVTIDEDGHGVAFTALRIGDDECSEGFLQGKFHNRYEGEGGIFRGRFVNEYGDLRGHLRGHYGVNDDDEEVFFGKYITEMGRFRGFLRGTYGEGTFDGVWHDRNGITEGTLDGKYVTGSEVDSGFFQGFWEAACE